MSESSGIGGSQSIPPSQQGGGTSGTPQGPTQGGVDAALNTPVSTLGQLKEVLVSNLGEQEGMKAYNEFMMSFAMQILQQIQQQASQAQQAAKQSRASYSS